jgi:DNA-binding NarL/FixJ family response regulator
MTGTSSTRKTPSSSPNDSGPSPEKHTKLRIFIADDSSMVRERLANFIAELENAELIGQAADVPSALNTLSRLAPDLVILDIRMPGGTGIQVLEQLKRSPSPPVVIMLTAFATDQYRQKCLALGADYFFDKSTEINLAFETIEHLAHQKRQNPNPSQPRQ